MTAVIRTDSGLRLIRIAARIVAASAANDADYSPTTPAALAA